MALVLNEEQQMLKTSAKEFLAENAPVEALRKLRDSNDPKGYEPALWKQMSELGFASITIPEDYGGMGFGFTGLGQVLEETGRTLTASPLVSTVLLGSTLINLAGTDKQKAALLPAIADGNLLVSVAFEESNAHKPLQAATSFTKDGDKITISGTKKFVLDGTVADKFIVTAKESADGELTLLVVDANSEGVSTKRTPMMDSRNAVTVTFDQVEVATKDILGDASKGKAALEKALDIARIGLSAEMLGSMIEAFDRTVAYLKERQQFGVPIGVFQGLQHRAADMYCEIENCKSLVIKSLQAIDADSKGLAVYASMTKAKISEVLKRVTNEAIQMYGGIGMTDDEEIGFFMKRARVAQRTFGDTNYHLNRFATLNGF
ncbi:MAG: acyl-CoA dehydrogenase family protein [Bacteroidota bacterium]